MPGNIIDRALTIWFDSQSLVTVRSLCSGGGFRPDRICTYARASYDSSDRFDVRREEVTDYAVTGPGQRRVDEPNPVYVQAGH